MSNRIIMTEKDMTRNRESAKYLKEQGFEVTFISEIEEAIRFIQTQSVDIAILETDREGCRSVKNASHVPLIAIADRRDSALIAGLLDAGADDCLIKPIDNKELYARIKAILRGYSINTGNSDDDVIAFDRLEVSLKKYELKIRGQAMDIPPRELELLYFLASNSNRVFTRDQLLDRVWGFDYLGDSRTVDVHIRRLREKLEGVSEQWSLKTIWGIGYKFEAVKPGMAE